MFEALKIQHKELGEAIAQLEDAHQNGLKHVKTEVAREARAVTRAILARLESVK